MYSHYIGLVLSAKGSRAKKFAPSGTYIGAPPQGPSPYLYISFLALSDRKGNPFIYPTWEMVALSQNIQKKHRNIFFVRYVLCESFEGVKYRKIPKVTALVTFGISSLWGSLLSGGSLLFRSQKRALLQKYRTEIRKKKRPHAATRTQLSVHL